MSQTPKKKIFDLKLLRKLMVYIRPHKVIFYVALTLTVVLAGLTTARPLIIQYTVDEFVIKVQDADKLLLFTLVLIGILLLETIVQFVFIYLANQLGQSIIRDLRKDLYRKVNSFRLAFFDRRPIGTLVTRNVSDIEVIANIFSEGLLVIFSDLLKIVVILISMFVFIDYRLVLISLSVLPLLYIATRWFQLSIKSSFQAVRNEVANLNAFVQERLSGVAVVQLFNVQKREYDAFKVINDRHRNANVRSIWYFSIFLPVIEILSAIAIGLAVWYGGIRAAAGDSITLGELIAIIFFVNLIFRPLRQLADRFNTLQMGLVAGERVMNILDNKEDIESGGEKTLSEVKGDIAFKNVWFGYNDDEMVIRDLSFKVDAGQTLAVVGATGAGKTTLISLLARYYPYQKGEITIDGKLIDDYTLNSVRQHLAVVLQDVFLFSDTVYQNIVMGNDVSPQTVKDAINDIGVGQFIDELPGGLDFQVGEKGGTLSAGQRQIIAFLRAYVSNPEILILDEATASLDSHSELAIQKAIDKITAGRTNIIIAHRLSTIRKADKILVMEKGRVVEEGNHEELLEKNGAYAR
ncbi:MAG: ABC transporter ATP-binding protein/permease, partial [Cryomorphaceae bacterium]|nr:ABC transporter ATP-binding protein/permease [Cryomorphaceae bacterium]